MQVHNNVRQRWQAGDPDVVGGMQEVAELAAQGRWVVPIDIKTAPRMRTDCFTTCNHADPHTGLHGV